MESAGTYVIVPLISGLCNVLIDRLLTENTRGLLMGRDSTRAELSKLKTNLTMVDKLVNNAEEQRDIEENVLFNDVKHAVYDAEDLLYEILTDALKKRLHSHTHHEASSSGIGQMFDNFTTALSEAVAGLNPFRENIDSKIQQLNRGFERFAKIISFNRHISTSFVGQPRFLLQGRETSSFVVPSEICGRESERDLIIQILEDRVSEAYLPGSLKAGKSSPPMHNDICCVAIIGMPGMGKTALAQLIFNHTRVTEIFNFRAWACVPGEIDIVGAIRSILTSSGYHHHHHHHDATNLDYYQKCLRREVAGKKILLVLDDVRDTNFKAKFEHLITSLKSAASGSIIIMTTYNGYIATEVNAIPISLNGLPDADCWKLFKMRAFGDPHAPVDDQRLIDIITKILAKCDGLPLAIKALGDVIRNIDKTAYRELDSIAGHRMWKQHFWPLPSLLLSYHYLPPSLRRCFAYCSIFPKNHLFDKDKLIKLWMAEGFIIVDDERDSKEMEDIGKEYFDMLLARSFFQVSGSNSHYFVMHDLIHALAVYVMEKFLLHKSDLLDDPMKVLRFRESFYFQTSRHFSFLQSKYETFSFIDECCKLRTFLPLGTIFTGRAHLCNYLLESLAKLTCLRVLSLCGYRITNIPPSIGSLKLLCYLDFSSTLIEELPDSVCNLSNLQTLLLSHCQHLRKLPEKMSYLIHLRHLDISGTRIYEMPDDVGTLSCLQTLTDFVIGKRPGNSIKELEKLSELRGTLRIKGLENVADNAEALVANLKEKSYLDEIVLEQSSDTYHQDALGLRDLDAFKPHTELRRLTIENYTGSLPVWLGDQAFCKLQVLNLVNCPNCESLPPLGQLPSLQDLLIKKLNKVGTLGPQFYGQHRESSPFKSLVTLKLEGLEGCMNWFPYDGDHMSFPSLRELYIRDCTEMYEIPSNLPSLAVLDIQNCRGFGGSLPRSPNLRKLSLNMVERLESTSLAELNCLTDLSFCLSEAVVIEGIRGVLPLLISLESLTMEYIPDGGNPIVGGGGWNFPSLIRTITAKDCCQEIDIAGSTSIEYLDISGCYSIQLPAEHPKLLHYLALSVKHGGLHINHEGIDYDLSSLHDLSISNYELQHFPALRTAQNLTTLSLVRCTGLSSLLNGMATHFRCLMFLSICDCEEFTSFSDDGFPAELKTLEIRSCSNLGSLPDRMSTCESFQRLVVDNCPLLQSLPVSGLPPKLHELHVKSCEHLVQGYADWQPNRLRSLQTLCIERDSKLESFPADGSLPTSLKVLTIKYFEALWSINCGELQRIPSLHELDISDCPNLRLFSEDDLPQSLCRLSIKNSPLAARCRKPDGHYVDKTSHITCLQLNS